MAKKRKQAEPKPISQEQFERILEKVVTTTKSPSKEPDSEETQTSESNHDDDSADTRKSQDNPEGASD
jgi:hypothetical protein